MTHVGHSFCCNEGLRAPIVEEEDGGGRKILRHAAGRRRDNAVIPYAVDVHNACRMTLTSMTAETNTLAEQCDRLANLIESETRFVMGGEFEDRREYKMMEKNWSVRP